MSGFLQTLLRCTLMIALWLGVTGAGVFAGPGTAAGLDAMEQADGFDSRSVMLDFVGGERICGDESGDESVVLCGGDLLAGLFAGTDVFVMSRATCSRLLEKLFEGEACNPEFEDCHQYEHGLPPRGLEMSQLAFAPVVTLRGRDRHDLVQDERSRQLRSADERLPRSRSDRPETPPPRVSVA